MKNLITLLFVLCLVRYAMPRTVLGEVEGPRPIAPGATRAAVSVLRYLDGLTKRKNARCLIGQAVGHNGSLEEAKRAYKKYVIALEQGTGGDEGPCL